MALPYKREEVKSRARATWRGACNVTLPSFSSDFRRLNADAVAHDVRLAARWGFWGTLVASECGTTLDEYVRFMEIAAEAAPSGFRLVAHLSFDTMEETLQAARAAEALGFEAALPSYPPSFVPGSPADVVAYTRTVADGTDLALILFAVMTWGFRSLDPRGFPLAALHEMSRFETAASIKYEAGEPGMVAGLAEVLRLCGEQVIVQSPMEQHAPGLITWFQMPFMGTSGYEAFGDRVPRWFKLLHEGHWDEGMRVYWSYQPAREAKVAFHRTFPGAGLIHRVGWKYLGWLHGMSGGLLRMPQMRLSPAQMKALRAGVVASGFEVRDDDRAFHAGRFPG